MRLLARYIVYIVFVTLGAFFILQPFVHLVNTGVFDLVSGMLYIAGGFTLAFVGVEASEAIRRGGKDG